jgi:hypothetical protein
VMYERSSRVRGSMIWYSSSMPNVSEGACIDSPRASASPPASSAPTIRPPP